MNKPLLSVDNLCVEFETEQGTLNVLDHVSFDVHQGKTLGLVGESGCGKSVTSLAIMKLLPQPAGRIRSGHISFKEQSLSDLAPKALQKIRGNRIAMIFQEPMTALNPVKAIGKQILEVFELHRPDLSKKQMLQETIEVLDKVGIPDASKRITEYPHQLSGGMRQRVMIAMALACKPDLLIADEPTTALDVTIQAQILDLMQSLQQEYGMGILFITHDLGVIAELCDDVVVMYAGRVAEKCSVKELFKNPKHPYTKGLLNSIPKLDQPSKSRLNTIEGQVPTLQNMPQGCRFYNRCQYKQDNCKTLDHSFIHQQGDTFVNCLHWQEI
ncbi:ABC transporter ATP-binding protein [Pseudomonas sp. HK3]